MSQLPFQQLNLIPEIQQAIEAMGFETATEIQSETIPLIQSGHDVIGRSQTGTGKTIAFGIPAIEKLDTGREDRTHVQVLILCPTRELAMQACEELKKLSKFLPGVRTADVYGGAPMDRQILKLKRANIVVGTPGRVMDHLRRRTMKLDQLKMIVLDEADEMLSMGFREDIETILQDTPEDRQTVLFSATMPPDIMALTRKYQNDPKIVEIDRKQVTVENIQQSYYDVPMGRKLDALSLLLRFYDPGLALIFCNTKSMVEQVAEYLNKQGVLAEPLHGDMKQSQRTKVMDGFKYGKTGIMVATDVAARGIDVNNINYVINYDIPQNAEYYVHRIGRTGRAGKDGAAITLCSGRRQVEQLLFIGRITRSKLQRGELPNIADIREKLRDRQFSQVQQRLEDTATPFAYTDLVERLTADGHTAEQIAAAALELHFGKAEIDIKEIRQNTPFVRRDGVPAQYSKVVLGIGRANRVAPNHIVGAITERTGLSGKDIGKIEIYDEHSVVGIPTSELETTLSALYGMKICGKPTSAGLFDHNRAGGSSMARRTPPPRYGAPSSSQTRRPRRPDAEGAVLDYRSLPKKKYSRDRV